MLDGTFPLYQGRLDSFYPFESKWKSTVFTMLELTKESLNPPHLAFHYQAEFVLLPKFAFACS